MRKSPSAGQADGRFFTVCGVLWGWREVNVGLVGCTVHPSWDGRHCPEDDAVKQKQLWRQVRDCIKIPKNNSNF